MRWINIEKKIIFVMGSMGSGGAERALLTLLSLLDYDSYEVDLLLYKHEGIFYNQIPKEVNILEFPETTTLFLSKKIFPTIKLLCTHPIMAFSKFNYILWRLFGVRENSRQKIWDFMTKSVPSLKKEYDIAIGYMQTWPIYFVIDKVKSKKKLGYIHTDYKKAGFDSEYDYKYFKELDLIVTVSEECVDVLKNVFPSLTKKIKLNYNITSTYLCRKMGLEGKAYTDNFNGIRIITVGRLAKVKGYDIAIKALHLLKEDGFNVRWYVIGKGPDKERIKSLIRYYNLESDFILLGEKSNPYPYIAQSDLYVQTSLYEGYCIAIDEALALGKVVVSTNSVDFEDRLVDGFTGIICNKNSESVYKSIKEVLSDRKLYKQIEKNLKSKTSGNETEMENFMIL